MKEFDDILENWIQVVDDKNDRTIENYGYDSGVVGEITNSHCVKCVAVNKCYFKNTQGKKPEQFNLTGIDIIDMIAKGLFPGLYHFKCHCKEIQNKIDNLEQIQLIIPIGKIYYLFENKIGWLDAMGYHENDRQEFVNVLLYKTKEAYFYGNYFIENISKYGCKINLYITIPGVNEKQGKDYKIKTNYMIFPNKKLKMNTPIGGWQK